MGKINGNDNDDNDGGVDDNNNQKETHKHMTLSQVLEWLTQANRKRIVICISSLLSNTQQNNTPVCDFTTCFHVQKKVPFTQCHNTLSLSLSISFHSVISDLVLNTQHVR